MTPTPFPYHIHCWWTFKQYTTNSQSIYRSCQHKCQHLVGMGHVIEGTNNQNFNLPTVSYLKNWMHLEKYMSQWYYNVIGKTLNACLTIFKNLVGMGHCPIPTKIRNVTLPIVSFLKNGIYFENYMTQRNSSALSITFSSYWQTLRF